MFLAKFFPFSERSGKKSIYDHFFILFSISYHKYFAGLNIVSEFNLDNLTEFGGDGGTDLKDLIDDDDVEDESKTENKYFFYHS